MIFREGTKDIGRVLYRERVEAAVDNANRTGHGFGGIGGQIMKDSHQFIRLQETSHRHPVDARALHTHLTDIILL